MKRKVYTDGNGSRLIAVQGLGEYLPASYFKEQQQEIAELKAQISLIKRHADGLMDSNSGIDYSGKMDFLLDAIDKAPQQCLASINADAVNEFANEYCLPCTTDYQVQLSKDAMHYCDKLKEQNNG